MRSDDIPNVTQAETDLEVRCGERNAESHNASSSASHFSKSVRSGAPPVVSVEAKDRPALYFPVKVAHPPGGEVIIPPIDYDPSLSRAFLSRSCRCVRCR